ncbi:MAG: alpha-D-ribose 1-methylphosphonate 5-triphosphate diphosphatase [Alphaproteobacteria bacterium]
MRPPEPKGTLQVFSRRVVLSDREVAATVVVEDGEITRLAEETMLPGALDCGADILIPGLVELHTDHLEPHYTPRPKVYWEPISAVFAYDAQIAASGITTVFDSLRVGRDDDRFSVSNALLELSEAIERAKDTGLLRADHHTHLRCEIPSNGVVEEAADYLGRFDVRLMSLMDHTPGQRQFRDVEKLRVYYRGKTQLDGQELEALFENRRQRAAAIAEPNKRALVQLARERGISLASHDDTLEDHVAESLADGVSIAEFPTTPEAAIASHKAGIAVLMGAPNVVRGGSHSGNVSAVELAERGVLDILSSDYVPISLIQGAYGLAGVPAMGGLPGAIRTVTKAPALATGMTDRGEIAVGLRGDLVRVALVEARPVVREVWRLGVRIS